MNDYETDTYESDDATAHYVALNKMNPDDLKRGDLICIDYIDEFYRELGITNPTTSVGLGSFYESMPAIASSPEAKQHLSELYCGSGLEVPTGLFELPLYWAKSFHQQIRETHWPAHPNCCIQEVFGWNLVLFFRGYLHIQFQQPIPSMKSHWPEVGEFILELHRNFEPGPFTPPGRLCEFV